MITKVKARLKHLFPNVNLSTKRIDEIAARLVAKVTNESSDEDIDAIINSANDFYPFADIAKDDDRLRNAEKKITPPADETKPAASSAENSQDIAAIVRDAIAPLIQEVNTLKAEKVTSSRTELLRTALKDTNVNEAYLNKAVKNLGRLNFATDDEFQTYLTDEVADAKAFAQTLVDADLAGVPRPAGIHGTGSATLSQGATDDLLSRLSV